MNWTTTPASGGNRSRRRLPGIRGALVLAVTAATLLLTMPIGDAMGFRNISASPTVPPGAKLPEVTTDEFTLLPALPIRPTAPNAINAGAFSTEVEPNGTTGTAQLLTGTSVRLRGNIQLGTDSTSTRSPSWPETSWTSPPRRA